MHSNSTIKIPCCSFTEGEIILMDLFLLDIKINILLLRRDENIKLPLLMVFVFVF